MIVERFLKLGEYAAAGAYEEPDRNLFYRKALALRRYYEHCELNEYRGEYLYPSGPRRISMRIHAAYLNGLSVADWQFSEDDKDLLATFNRDFRKYKSSVLPPHTVAGNMWTHSMPNYERILKEGFNSYVERINRIDDKDLREGLLHLIEGIRSYQQRCVTYLKSVGANEKLICALEKVPFSKAENIYEALVCWNFVLYLDGCDNLGCVASGLAPYHSGENVVPILQNLYDNLDKNEAWSMSLSTDYSPLTLQCLEASKGKRRPMIELFVNENTPNEVWEKAFEVIRTNNGQPAFYNPEVLLGGLQRRFPDIPDEDIKKFCGGGCTESMLAGLSNVGSLDAGINLLYLFEKC